MSDFAILHTSVAPLDQEVGEHGTTVRKGTKWLGYDKEYIDLCVCTTDNQGIITHTNIGCGKIVTKGSCQFINIPSRIIELEHCEDARTYEGLLKAMRNAYGEFNECDVVTFIEYVRIR